LLATAGASPIGVSPLAARPGAGLAACLGLLALLAVPWARAQTLEPRSYTNVPVDTNFLIAGYNHSSGDVAFDPAVPLTDAHLTTDSSILAFARSFGAWSKSAKFDVVAPIVSMYGDAIHDGERVSRDITGMGDPQFRVSMNFYGAPALDWQQFRDYHQDLILGASLAVTAPFGQYDDRRLVNIGANRWAIKPELGASKAIGPWLAELYGAVTFYTRNNDFLDGGYVELDPLYSTQFHVTRNFPNHVWVAFNANYYWGARATVNGRRTDTLQASSRFGLTLAVPVNRRNSIKLYGATGVWARTGSGSTNFGIAWQYRWGPGL